jgi:hypothetical protein
MAKKLYAMRPMADGIRAETFVLGSCVLIASSFAINAVLSCESLAISVSFGF